MSAPPNPALQGKCTTCQKTWWLTAAQIQAAREMGCAFSPCCQAVATIESVKAKLT
jgi:hypothetical protein